MIETTNIAEPPILFVKRPGEGLFVELRLDDQVASRLSIIPFTLTIGAARVRMDGIGGVATRTEHRNQGYARRILDASVERMRRGRAALSMLYGIPDFYPRFGYATAGPDFFLVLTDLDHADLPAGWRARSHHPADLPVIQRLYDQATDHSVGAAVRGGATQTWSGLQEGSRCRVVEDPAGQVRGYAWRGAGFWYLDQVQRHDREALAIAEAIAEDPTAARALLSACAAWGKEENEQRPVNKVILCAPPEGPLAAAARLQQADLVAHYVPCGASMARVLSVRRLMDALQPELQVRQQEASSPFTGTLEIRTDIGAAVVPLGLPPARPDDAPAGEATLRLKIPQHQLARLALGAFPPDDILDQLPRPPSEPLRKLIRILFPERHPHMHLPDRF